MATSDQGPAGNPGFPDLTAVQPVRLAGDQTRTVFGQVMGLVAPNPRLHGARRLRPTEPNRRHRDPLLRPGLCLHLRARVRNGPETWAARCRPAVRARSCPRPRGRPGDPLLCKGRPCSPVAGRGRRGGNRRRTWRDRLRHAARPVELAAAPVLGAGGVDRVRGRVGLRQHPARQHHLSGAGDRGLRRLHDLRFQPPAPGRHAGLGPNRRKHFPGHLQHLPVLPRAVRKRAQLGGRL
jgi:hypothetical protein